MRRERIDALAPAQESGNGPLQIAGAVVCRDGLRFLIAVLYYLPSSTIFRQSAKPAAEKR